MHLRAMPPSACGWCSRLCQVRHALPASCRFGAPCGCMPAPALCVGSAADSGYGRQLPHAALIRYRSPDTNKVSYICGAPPAAQGWAGIEPLLQQLPGAQFELVQGTDDQVRGWVGGWVAASAGVAGVARVQAATCGGSG